MRTNRSSSGFHVLFVIFVAFAWCCTPVQAADASLPAGVRAVWDPDKAWHESTPTRDRVCLNGLWRWQPARGASDAVPADAWGFFKVPGCWPGITDYMQKDSQRVFAHPSWKGERLSGVGSAWYQREFQVPPQWARRRITLRLEYLDSFAAVYVDGRKAGEVRFPGGDLDITAACKPGQKQVVSLLVVAMPLGGVMLSYNDSNAARQVKGSVERRGLCGDVYLDAGPAGPRIADVKVDTSVRRGEIAFDAAVEGLAPDGRYTLRAEVADAGRRVAQFTSQPFGAADLKAGRIAFTQKWKPDKLWDLHTPQNVLQVGVSLQDASHGEKVLDAALPVRLGFREFWIQGRDFYLNGSRVFLSCVPLDNAQVSAALASYAGARESLQRLKAFGINFVYTHNYGCEPGSHLGFAEVLRAADDVGMLVSFSQPHFGQYNWKAPDADAANGYARHAEYYVRAAQNHPAVVAYSMSHNATGYSDDMNPDMIDGLEHPRDNWSANNAKLALRAEAIVKRLDAGRIVYHHSSGNLGSMHTSNFYPNFAPIQELCDWFEHWATVGVKPVFTCEYGAPFTWDWSMYRGWYKGQRSFGSAAVPWEFCFAEWNAQFLGERAYNLSEPEKANIRWEAKQFRSGRVWHRWDYPCEIGSREFDDRHTVMGMYLSDNWRAYRTWGVSAISPWEHGHFWKLRPGMNRNQLQNLSVDWEKLQRPGFSPDYLQDRYERMDTAYEPADWVPTADGQSLLRNNRPLLAYLAGGPAHFTAKDHIFLPGQTIRKQVIVINNSRLPAACECAWTLEMSQPVRGSKSIRVETGQQARIPLECDLSGSAGPGAYPLTLSVKFDTGEVQKDTFTIHVLAASKPTALGGATKIALFDPKGETAKWLDSLGVEYTSIQADADLSAFDVLVIGKAALTVDGPGPDVSRVKDGLRVVVFEQTSQVLEKRLGFRVVEYGLRQVWPRVSDHPLLAGLNSDHLRDWRGEATINPPRLKYEMRPMYGPTVKWCDIDVTRVWRCGNYGNVASVLIEKPARGNFLPIADGGFSLQYAPLMEYREGKGMILFCQLDVTGRTEIDPAAERIGRNIVRYVMSGAASRTSPTFVVPPSGGPAPTPSAQGVKRDALTGTLRAPTGTLSATGTVIYVGEAAGKSCLARIGVEAEAYEGGELPPGWVLVVGPGGGRALAGHKTMFADWLAKGGRLLAIGLDQDQANAFLPFKVTMKKAEHIAACFGAFGPGSPLAGISPADVHNRDPRELPLLTGGATIVGDGVLAMARWPLDGTGSARLADDPANIVLCQIVPWQFDLPGQYNLRRTFRRTSVLMMRLLGGMGVSGQTPLLGRFGAGADQAKGEKRWLDGLYLDKPEEYDDPYRFFRW